MKKKRLTLFPRCTAFKGTSCGIMSHISNCSFANNIPFIRINCRCFNDNVWLTTRIRFKSMHKNQRSGANNKKVITMQQYKLEWVLFIYLKGSLISVSCVHYKSTAHFFSNMIHMHVFCWQNYDFLFSIFW